MKIQIIKTSISKKMLGEAAKDSFGNMVKGTVDIEKEIIALGGDLHSDSESELIKSGCLQKDIWGFNIHPQKPKEEWLEFTSLINIRPNAGNLSMEIQDEKIKDKIKKIIQKLIR